MKYRWIAVVMITLYCMSNISCKKQISEVSDTYKILDPDLPDLESKIFATGIISKDNRYEQYCSFSPDGSTFYFSYTDSIWGKSTIVKVNMAKPYQQPNIYLTTSDYQSGQFIDVSGSKLFFTSILFSGGIWHSDIYLVKKDGKRWGKPIQLDEPVNSYICEWHPSLTDEGIMYFASERNYDHGVADIYKAIPKNGKYKKVERLSTNVNTQYNETDPLIAPDESFLIFSSNRPGGVSGPDMDSRPNGYDELDLYICFNRGNNNWSSPKNMGNGINTAGWEFAPALSPDGKYLFFTRREAFNTLAPSEIYWVSSKVTEQLKEQL